jgi:4-hydroxybenzoate polyprenyltransferase
MVLLQVNFRWEPLIIAFCSTFFLYNLNRKTDIKEDIINYPERIEFFERYGNKIFRIALVLYLLSLLTALLNNILTLGIILLPLIFVVVYSVFRLKRIILIKNVFVGMGWATISLLVISYSNSYNTLALIIVTLFIFLRVLMGSAIFDVKDIKGDKIYKISTIPEKYGIKKLKYFSAIINTIAGLIIFYFSFIEILPPQGFLVFLITFYSYFVILLIDKKDIKFISNILVDGDGHVMAILSLIGKIIWQ